MRRGIPRASVLEKVRGLYAQGFGQVKQPIHHARVMSVLEIRKEGAVQACRQREPFLSQGPFLTSLAKAEAKGLASGEGRSSWLVGHAATVGTFLHESL